MKITIELNKEKEDNDYLQGELDKFKGFLTEKNEQNAAIQRDRDCMEQKFLKQQSLAINLENDLCQIHRYIVVKCCQYCQNFSKAKAMIDQRIKYLRVMKVKAENSDKVTDKLGELRESKKEKVQLGHKIDELQHIIDSMKEVEAKKRMGLDEEIVKLLEDKLDLQKRVKAE